MKKNVNYFRREHKWSWGYVYYFVNEKLHKVEVMSDMFLTRNDLNIWNFAMKTYEFSNCFRQEFKWSWGYV